MTRAHTKVCNWGMIWSPTKKDEVNYHKFVQWKLHIIKSIKRRQTGRKTNRQTKKVKVFLKEMSKDYTIYTKSKQTKAKKLKKSKLDTSNLIKVKEIVFNFKKIF